MDNTLLIAIAEIRPIVKENAGKPLEDRLRIAMRKIIGYWCVTDEDKQFRAAIGAVLCEADDEEKIRIEEELDTLKVLNAAISGVPVNFDAVRISENPIGLVKLWREIKEAEKAKEEKQ